MAKKSSYNPLEFEFGNRGEWLERAKCRTMDPTLFDTVGTCDRPKEHAHARILCKGCPVIVECARMALATRAEGVVMAGVPLPPANNSKSRQLAVARLKARARGKGMGRG